MRDIAVRTDQGAMQMGHGRVVRHAGVRDDLGPEEEERPVADRVDRALRRRPAGDEWDKASDEPEPDGDRDEEWEPDADLFRDDGTS